jgi:hypothetical protein
MPGSDTPRLHTRLVEPIDGCNVVMRNHLREEVLPVEIRGTEVGRLEPGVRVRIGPAAERQTRHVLLNRLAQLPGVANTSWRSDGPVAAQDDQRSESFVGGPLGVVEAEAHRVLACQERDHVVARHIGAQVVHQVTEVVLFAGADRAVGEKHEGAVPDEPAYRMVGVDPGVAARGRVQFCARRTQLD